MTTRKFRRKAVPVLEADEEEEESLQITPAAYAAVRKDKGKDAPRPKPHAKQTGAGRLSFDDGEDPAPRAPASGSRTVQLDSARFKQLNVHSGASGPVRTQTAAPGRLQLVVPARVELMRICCQHTGTVALKLYWCCSQESTVLPGCRS